MTKAQNGFHKILFTGDENCLSGLIWTNLGIAELFAPMVKTIDYHTSIIDYHT